MLLPPPPNTYIFYIFADQSYKILSCPQNPTERITPHLNKKTAYRTLHNVPHDSKHQKKAPSAFFIVMFIRRLSAYCCFKNGGRM
jgi:hypothetical protein